MRLSYPKYEYAIRFPNGLYYTGRVNSDAEPNAWQGRIVLAFTFTEEGAYKKIASLPDVFAGCVVQRIL